ncbi:proteasome subunit beta type-1, putative [Plasmodium vinckei]|uniref:Proteasome subunit beta n=3 Tax=Plasmodium vinckei TaxID=5860 RepID=W7AUU1_PLAVN|nr:20S proteasome subunit beta 6 [Plasmodium vinckei petteri]CAD2098999.1 proteasome subunit beta type-1, putative [Plasmodium vinckei brucechwatti]CAD2110073.1 proteasome subunit beta type-1, putative [Plasmodium vinckei]CAD2110177.1 proteasome subunit beta type-1, putative [Plasmodium vinckei petteri]
MEILQLNNNSVEKKKAEENEAAIEHARPSKRWNPYVDNGGTVIGLTGKDYVILAGDTRLSLSYSIYTRNCPKISKITDKCIIGSSGMQSDIKTLHSLLQKKIQLFYLEHSHYPSVHVIAKLLCVTLYSRRFFPYYTFNILAGIDENGKGVLYSYDAIGSYYQSTHACTGSGSSLILPILDNRVEQKNQLIKNMDFNLGDDINFVKDAMTSATERDIYTGDQAEIYIIDSLGINTTLLDLKKD